MRNWMGSNPAKIAIFAMLLIAGSIACSSFLGNLETAPETNEPADAGEPAATETLFAPLQLTETQPPFETSVPGDPADPTPPSVSLDMNTVFGEVIDSLPVGSALFDPAEEMRLGQVYQVEVRVSPVSSEEIEEDEDLKATLTADLDTGAPVIIVPVRVSTVMSAKLTGSNFTIIPLTEEEQIRDSSKPFLRWLWDVQPDQKGEQRLTLHISVVVNAEGLGDKLHTVSEVRDIIVTANPLYSTKTFFGQNWEWVATGLVLPAVGWLWRWIRARRSLTSS